MEVSSRQFAPKTPPSTVHIGRRRLIVRDGLKFLTLTLVAIAMSGMTTFLFRSFEARREDLSVRWAQRGRDALQQGHPEQAVTALHIALSYHADSPDNELALAQALAASGHINEAENYFLNLWQARPGDGPINLQLARLERSKGDARTAIDYYQAAVFGTWAGDALTRRRDTRLELSKYLIEQGQLQSARAELAVAAGNNPDPATQLVIAQLLEAAEDPKDAFIAYRNAGLGSDTRFVAQAKAGELCHRLGDYACAASLLDKALQYTGWTPEQKLRMTNLQKDSERLQELSFGSDVPLMVRMSHLLNDGRIAQSRLQSCVTPAASASMQPSSPLAPLQSQWNDLNSAKNRAALRHDEDLQEQYASLIFETEGTAATTCGPLTGDDALLLYLRDHPATHAGAQ